MSGTQLAATSCGSGFEPPCRHFAAHAILGLPTAVTTGPDGSVYFTDTYSHFVFRLDLQGELEAIAGTGVAGVTGDGGAGMLAKITEPRDLVVSPEGAVYVEVRRVDPLFPGNDYAGIRRILSDGRIDTVVGRNHPECAFDTYCGEGGNPRAAQLRPLSGLTRGHDGSIYLSLRTDNRIVRVHSRMPGASLEEIHVPSEDGRELYVFDPFGRHDRTVDPVLGTTLLEFGYDGSLLRTITDRDGRVTTISHDGNGEPTKIVGPYGHETLLATHTSGFVSEIADPLSQVFTLAYDPPDSGLLTTLGTPLGPTKTYEYDALGLLEKANDPPFVGDPLEGGWKSFARTEHGPRRRSVNMATAGGRTASYYVDTHSNGNTDRQVAGFDGLVTKTHVDPAEVTTVSFPCGMTCQPNGVACTSASQCCSDECTGGVCGTGSCEPAGAVCEVDIDCCSDECTGGFCEAVPACAAGATVLRSEPAPDPRWGMLAPTASVTFDTGGKTLEATTQRSVELSDPGDLLSVDTYEEVVTVNGRAVTTVVDRTVSPVTVTQVTEAGRESITELNAKGRPTKIEVVNTLGFVPTVMTYYASGAHAGRLQTVKRGSGANERLYELFYDSEGELESIEDPLGQTVSFVRDAVGRVTKQTLPDASAVSFGYDSGGNLTKLFQPGTPPPADDDEIHTFVVNALNLAVSYTPPYLESTAEPTTHLWNIDHQLEQTVQPGPVEIDFGYDPRGRLDTITTPTNMLALAYTPSDHASAPGKLAAVDSELDEVLLSYEHHGELLLSMKWEDDDHLVFGANGASVSFVYDNDLAVTKETVTVDGTDSGANYAYADDDGLLTQAGALVLTRDAATGVLTGATIGELVESYGYNVFGELASYEVELDGTTPETKYLVVYERDALGRVVKKTETVGSQTTVHHYVYDLAGRLESVYHQQSGTPCDPLTVCDRIAHYTYDANGNRESYQPLSGSPVEGTYDSQDRLTSYDGKDYLYTANGELERTQVGSVDHTIYQYDPMGLLRRVTLPTNDDIDYVYDGAGRRIGRKKGSTARWWIYRDALEPVAELNGDGELVSRFVYGTKAHVPDYVVKGTDTYRLVTDQLGSVRLVVDVSDGTVVQEITYDAWGRATLVSGTWGVQPFGFAGGLYDPDTGLVRFGARDYDAEVGRWTAKDPIRFAGGQGNLYLYVAGNPLNFTDPSGLASPHLTAWSNFQTELTNTLFGASAYFAIRAGSAWDQGSYRAAIFDGAVSGATGFFGALVSLNHAAQPLLVGGGGAKFRSTDALRRHNGIVRDAAKSAGLNKAERQLLHRELQHYSPGELSFDDILEIALGIKCGN